MLRCLATDFLERRAFAWRGPQRKHSFFSVVACIRVYKAVAWQRVDRIRYSMYPLPPPPQLHCQLITTSTSQS
jgi:hypothetical protein